MPNQPNPPPSTPRPAAPRSQAAPPPPLVRYYSPSTRGFYSSDVHTRAQMPQDVRTVSDQQYRALMASQSKGQQIVPDAQGNPTTITPQISAENKAAQIESIRKAELAASDSRLIQHLSGEAVLTHAQLAGLFGYRKTLRAGGAVLPPKPDFLR